MGAWTLEEAKKHLQAWLAAELAIAEGHQSYEVEGQRITRADVEKVAERVRFWSAEVARLSATGSSGPRVIRVVPRDL